MPPIVLLGILLAITVAAVIADRWHRRRGRAVYRKLAIEHRMHYSPGDPLRLTPRIAAQLPLPGAAGVRVIDLLYRTDEQSHHYVFTAEYTIGVVGPKHRVRRAAAFTESKSGPNTENTIRFAPADLPLPEQYRTLMTP